MGDLRRRRAKGGLAIFGKVGGGDGLRVLMGGGGCCLVGSVSACSAGELTCAGGMPRDDEGKWRHGTGSGSVAAALFCQDTYVDAEFDKIEVKRQNKKPLRVLGLNMQTATSKPDTTASSPTLGSSPRVGVRGNPGGFHVPGTCTSYPPHHLRSGDRGCRDPRPASSIWIRAVRFLFPWPTSPPPLPTPRRPLRPPPGTL